jgi:general stress protein YciG
MKKITPSEAARLLGRRGGLKGGKARAAALSPARRKEIARKGGKASWQSRKKKFLVIPGTITSKSDGDRHFIGARELMRLYRVKQEECVVMSEEDVVRYNPYSSKYPMNLVRLEPRYDGDYSQFWL